MNANTEKSLPEPYSERREQASFVKEIQVENSSYCATLHKLKSDHELGVNVQSALDAFEAEKKSSIVTNFWTEIQNLEEEKMLFEPPRWGTSTYSGKRTNLPTNFHQQPEVQQELRESGAEFNTMRIGMFGATTTKFVIIKHSYIIIDVTIHPS
ncbi:2246_t:CDS:2 [Ambispora gerdemannii]|uniref:2246_t:CDS:1 n=1 Tax=Ambispora gerdemannii TaxID=144530 RepID=A0A9N8W7P0_9GLOM|nr:2246_t:CDS:2 [Ambispora gerdemannii]